MARLVYIPMVNKKTYLHLAVWKETVQFRDFSESDKTPPIPFGSPLTRQQIEDYLKVTQNAELRNQPEGHVDPGVDGAEAIAIWHRCVKDKNRLYIPADPEAEREKREAERRSLEVEHEAERRRLELLKKKRQATILWWNIVGGIFAVIAVALGFFIANWKQILAFIQEASK